MDNCTCAEWGICHNCYDEKCDEVKKLKAENAELKDFIKKCSELSDEIFKEQSSYE